MTLETRKFNKSQASDILYSGGIMDDQGLDELYNVVSDEVTDTDQEKGRVTRTIVIQEVATKKCFIADLSESPWWKQAEANAEEVWTLVIPYTVTVTKYRTPNKSDLRDMKIEEVVN
jgi:hypothetical protein